MASQVKTKKKNFFQKQGAMFFYKLVLNLKILINKARFVLKYCYYFIFFLLLESQGPITSTLNLMVPAARAGALDRIGNQ